MVRAIARQGRQPLGFGAGRFPAVAEIASG